MYHKALAYAAELQDSINKAQNISEENEVNANEPQDIELVTNKNKKKPPPSSIKESSYNRKNLPRSTKEKINYGNNTSESETDSDDLIAYKIPRKNEISDIKKKNEIELTNDVEVRNLNF